MNAPASLSEVMAPQKAGEAREGATAPRRLQEARMADSSLALQSAKPGFI